ncbi:hypothetical protein M409DRAFT_25822 [Zasmidium cellare ATCC 36951]|uniref:Uncharacterized protein n=1 Tax=Zasmidium cellare ATCC 36951 TaxID=1080233 RepID=A0A6A6C917_ZASCE|nr:uncharacterized protein M409DRAFT_25822 [Zasmidium cellare ATCC 36951]KAF2163634.1 hypothetical protein M409DRAFT_25822 [Zasmidium cellare ATCC 36951]
MADSNENKPQESKSSTFIRGAGNVRDPDNQLWWPARWVVQMIQYLVAIMVVTMAEGIKSIVSGERPKRRHHRQE